MDKEKFAVYLLDDMTGRIRVKNISGEKSADMLKGSWSVEVDGIESVSGQFILNSIFPDESKDLLLSPETGAVYPGQRQYLIIRIFNDDGTIKQRCDFPMENWCRTHFPEEKNEFFTGMRADPVQSIISSGKLAAVISSSGMKELTYNGENLISSAPVLRIWRAGAETAPEISALQLDRMKISSDRFGTVGENSIEIHSLALPKAMDVDELEFTQRFTPISSGAIRYDLEFIVPESFSGIPRIGIEFKVPEKFNKFNCCGSLENEKIWTDHQIVPGKNYKDVDFALFGSEKGDIPALLIASGGKSFYLSVTNFSEFAMLDAMEMSTEPKPDGWWCHIDCRVDDENYTIAAGRYRMVLILAAFTGEIPPAAAARKKSLYC